MKQRIVRIALGLLVMLVFLVHAARLYPEPIRFITQLDNIIYDFRLRRTMPKGVDNRIVILDIDEKSLAEIGRWPWGRDRLASLIEKLFDKYGIVLLGIDVVFAEPDVSSGLPVLEGLAKNEIRNDARLQSLLGKLRPMLDHDGLFAKAIKGRPVVLGYFGILAGRSAEEANETGALPDAVLPPGTFAGKNIAFTTWKGYSGNLPQFQKNAAGGGHIEAQTDFDGVLRRVPMLAEYKGAYYEAFSLAMIRTMIALDSGKFPNVVPGYAPDRFISKGYPGLEWLEVGPLRVPVDEEASALIPYRGEQGSFRYFSLADVMAERTPVEALKGKIALVGTTARGLFDLRSTPVSGVYPGVEVHANLIAGMFDRSIKQKPRYVQGAELILLLIGGVVLAILVPFLSPLRATLVSLASLALIIGLNLAMWSINIVLPLAASLLMTVALFALNMSYGYFVESRSTRQIKELFGQYVPPELVPTMAKDAKKYNMEPRDAELTILFCDVRGFTGISEALTPDHLREYINEYLTEMSAIIRSRHKGTLDKYIGDAIMAFWGAPVNDPDHARNGVLAALEMQRECLSLTQRFESRGWPQLKIGIGLNSGTVRVGDMGSRVRRAYTVIGDPVNVASRTEGLTKHYGVGILVGEATKNKVMDVVFREIDKVRVKGKDEALTIFEPIGLDVEVEQKVLDELRLWHQTLKAYRARHWDQVEVSLLNLQRMSQGCALYELYSRRVPLHRRTALPEEWDGVTVFDEK